MTIHDQFMTICNKVDLCQRISYNVCIMVPSSTNQPGDIKMLQDRIFKVMQSIVNSAAYPFILGAGFACFLAYIIVKGL